MTGAESGGALGMTVTEGPRGEALPLHVHRATYEGIYCLEGRMRVTAGGEEHLLTRGDFVSIPPGIEHTCALEGHLTRYVSMYGPAGPERFFALAGEVAEHRIFPETAPPVDRARLEAAAAQLDIAFEG
jgi:quercetin 2,3-dioxygenase